MHIWILLTGSKKILVKLSTYILNYKILYIYYLNDLDLIQIQTDKLSNALNEKQRESPPKFSFLS